MKSKILLLSCLVCLPAFSETRIWTSSDGKTIEAELVERTESHVKIKRADGVVFEVEPTRFSEADQKYIQSFPIVKTLTKEELASAFLKFPKIQTREPLPFDYEPLVRLQKDFARKFEFLREETYRANLLGILKEIESEKKYYAPIANSNFRPPTRTAVGTYTGGSASWKEGMAAGAALVWFEELRGFIKEEYGVQD